MFGKNKGDHVTEITQAAKELRQKIDNISKEGLLKHQIAEKILLDIRHTKLTA